MDSGKLKEMRTFGQKFGNNPNEKFFLMILGSQAKLENDNRGINVVRGLCTRAEMGLWSGIAPLGYLTQGLMDKKCLLPRRVLGAAQRHCSRLRLHNSGQTDLHQLLDMDEIPASTACRSRESIQELAKSDDASDAFP